MLVEEEYLYLIPPGEPKKLSWMYQTVISSAASSLGGMDSSFNLLLA
jgi:hypothetical protein